MKEERYHYTECGLDNIYLLNGFDSVETSHGRSIVIEDVDGLHDAIGRYLIHEKKKLDGREVRFLRLELGLSQSSLGILLGVDEQSVARWEKGQTAKFAAAEKIIRALYSEHVGGNEKISEFLKQLADLDEILTDELSFTDTEEGWRPFEAA